MIVICPITDARHIRQLYPSDVLINAREGGLRKDSVVLTGQVRAVAKHRLYKQLGQLSSQLLSQVDRALKITLNLS